MSIETIYIAAPWVEKDRAALDAHQKVVAAGFTPTSRWILRDPGDGYQSKEAALLEEARNDIEDVKRADLLLLLNTQKRGEETSGKAVETGMAIAWEKPIICVGEWSNVFHFLPTVVRVWTVEEAIRRIVDGSWD